MTLRGFFYYDPEDDGFQTESTFERAESSADKSIRSYLDGCWMEEVEGVCMGVILKKATRTYERKRPEDSDLDDEGYDSAGYWWGRKDSDDGLSEYDEIWNYTLEPVKIPDAVMAIIPTADLVHELEKRSGVESAMIQCDDGVAKTLVIHNFVIPEVSDETR